MIKDFLQRNDIKRIKQLSGKSRAYINEVLDSIEDLDDAKLIGEHTEGKRSILDAVNTVINQRISETESNWRKQQAIHKRKITRLRNCAKALAR